MKAVAIRGGALAVLVGAGLGLGGCTLTGVNPSGPSSARVQVSAPAGVSLKLLTSKAFLVNQVQTDQGVQNSVQFVSSDTSWSASPVDTTFDISDTQRFLVYVLDADTTNVPVHLKVWLDDQLRYDHTQTYPGGDELQFIYVFN